MQEEKPVRRGVYILPNLFTTASLFTGFFGMILAVQGNIEGCALAILFSALMDGLDGKVARLTNTASEFGIQFDSLADLVAFGVAPAFMAWMWVLNGYGRLGIGVAFLFVACTALRLARFNVSTAVISKRFFIGLPSPAGGCALAMFVLFSPYMGGWLESKVPFLALCVTFILPLLMVSRVRYFSFKEYGFIKTHTFSSMVTALLIFVLILSEPRVIGFTLGVIYLLSGPIYTFIILPRRNRLLLGSLTQN
ncbi:MAG: CDP-diacylglycerol--serine O-phosphatidyltransferase [Bilophila sp.]